MKRRLPVALILVLLVAGTVGASIASAQDAPTQVGEEVTFVDPEGIIRGTVTVREVADPFTGHDPNAPPEPGSRYVSLTVTYQAALDQPFDAQPYEIMLQSDDGTLFDSVYVARPADSTIPDLQPQQLAPDNRISGIVSYTVPADTVIQRIVYQPASDRLLDLADLAPGTAPAPGDAVTYTYADGSTASITTEVMDPFTDFDPAYPPAEGSRFVVLRPVFENVGELPYWAEPFDMVVRDSSGFLHTPASVYTPPGHPVPPLEGQTMSPGDRVSGLVGFAIPADRQVSEVLYYPESGRLVTLADLDGGGGTAPPEPAGSPAPAASAAPVASPAPAASPTPDPSAGVER
jgi:hypothetical protein